MLHTLLGVRGMPLAPDRMQIQVELREAYGRVLAYPHPLCEAAQALSRIARRKTLSREVLDEARALGYSVVASQARPLLLEDVE